MLLIGVSTNRLDPLFLCPGGRLANVKVVPLMIHADTPVTLHVNSIGNGVRPGRYVTLLGPSIIRPV